MQIPQLLILNDENEYKDHYVKNYCYGTITTIDGYEIKFRFDRFFHAFFKSRPDKSKSELCYTRARRMDWIKFILESNNNTVLHEGWDRRKRRHTRRKRAALYNREYVVVINILNNDKKQAIFNTAYHTGVNTLRKIEESPLW